MSGGYDDRDGKIWVDGTLVDWRSAQVHILTHAMHYASSVFEGSAPMVVKFSRAVNIPNVSFNLVD